jgi:hypothetical protein
MRKKGENMKSFRSLGGALSIAALLGLLLVSIPASAQTLNSLTMERAVSLTNIFTTITPNVPANVLASIASGAVEIREQTNYNPAASTLTSNAFLVPAGSPNPTNLGTVPPSSFLAVFATAIDKIYITASSVQIVGTISQSSATPFGNYQGAPATFSFGFTKDTPPKINTVIETIAGAAGFYSPAATGTFSITQPTTPGGGPGSGTGVTVVVNGVTGNQSIQTTVNQVNLDASASTSSNAGALTYTWSIPQGSPSASISFPGGNTAKPFVQLTSGKVTYVIVLTVTDATGATGTATLTISYL